MKLMGFVVPNAIVANLEATDRNGVIRELVKSLTSAGAIAEADSETIAGLRLRRLLAEDKPAIQGYDQDEYARRLRYQDRPMEPSLQAFEAARATTAQLMDLMTDADWQRAGTHSEMGSYPAERFLQVYSAHAHDHAAQIRKNREAWAAGRR